MKLSALLRNLANARVIGDADAEVSGVQEDSREIRPGDVFVALSSRATDGHGFVDRAVASGAVAVVVEREVSTAATQVIVPNSAAALGVLAADIVGRPGDSLSLIGITGTNGKTTTTYLVEAILAAAAHRPGVVGTVSYRYGGREVPAPYTTPTPLLLHRVFADMTATATSHAILEVSSAALHMDRMAGVAVDVAAFTNLTQDHLDVHGTMAEYRTAKARLFTECLRAGGVAVINRDDPAADYMIDAAAGKSILTVSAQPGREADVMVLHADSTIDGIRARVTTPRGELEVDTALLLGHYNVANIAMAIAISEALEVPHQAIAAGIAAMPGVPGRVERVANDADLDILVDYAHTPDALANVLTAVKPLARRRLICVFGCGGDRDQAKRPLMGAAVAAHADLAVVTSDNPRSEEPQAIIDMILPAVPSPFFVDPDRRTAIRAAIAVATPGDIVVIAGKGHEDYQILGSEKIHFDDREEARAAADQRPSFTVEEVVQATGGQLLCRGHGNFARAIIDGRIAAPGDLYFAVRGERFDGHEFCAQAAGAGASGLVVDTDPGVEATTVIAVEDTRVAIGKLAQIASRRWTLAASDPERPEKRLIAVTGSAGKTTTKELIAAALSGAGRVHKSVGSLNNETGVPLTLLELRPYHDFAVVEMGMRAVGQIAYLVDIAEPHVGVVVNAGSAHLGVVGSIEAIARGKAEVFGALPSYGWAVFPADDERLAGHAASAPHRITFGDASTADVALRGYRPRGGHGSALIIAVDGAEHEIELPLVGHHNAINATCAIATAIAVGVPVTTALSGLTRARPAAMRSQVDEIAGRNFLIDCYNANPAATRAALVTLAELRETGAATAVLGDMLELGDTAAAAHADVGRAAAELDITVVALGEHAGDIAAGVEAAGGRVTLAASPDEAAKAIISRTQVGDWILVKASRGMRLERVIEAIRTGAANHRDRDRDQL